MDGWETHTSTFAHTQTLSHFCKWLTSLKKWASSKTCMNRIWENGRSWWEAVWSLIRVVSLCWVAFSSTRKLWLKPRLGPSTFRVRQEDIFQGCDGTRLNRWDWGLLTNHFHEAHTNRAIDRKTTQDSHRLPSKVVWWERGLVADRCRLSAETSLCLFETEADCACRHVSQTFSALKVGFSWGTVCTSFYLSLSPVLWLSLSDTCACICATDDTQIGVGLG